MTNLYQEALDIIEDDGNPMSEDVWAISAKELAEKASRILEERHFSSLFFDHGGLNAVVIGPSGLFVYVSNVWAKKLGYTKKEMVGKPYFQYVYPADAKRTQAAWAQFQTMGGEFPLFMNRWVKKNGEVIVLLWESAGVEFKEEGNTYYLAKAIEIAPNFCTDLCIFRQLTPKNTTNNA